MRGLPRAVVVEEGREALEVAKGWEGRASTVWADGSRLGNSKVGRWWCGGREHISRPMDRAKRNHHPAGPVDSTASGIIRRRLARISTPSTRSFGLPNLGTGAWYSPTQRRR